MKLTKVLGGAGVGFVVGGPIGAAVGAVAGALLPSAGSHAGSGSGGAAATDSSGTLTVSSATGTDNSGVTGPGGPPPNAFTNPSDPSGTNSLSEATQLSILVQQAQSNANAAYTVADSATTNQAQMAKAYASQAGSAAKKASNLFQLYSNATDSSQQAAYKTQIIQAVQDTATYRSKAESAAFTNLTAPSRLVDTGLPLIKKTPSTIPSFKPGDGPGGHIRETISGDSMLSAFSGYSDYSAFSATISPGNMYRGDSGDTSAIWYVNFSGQKQHITSMDTVNSLGGRDKVTTVSAALLASLPRGNELTSAPSVADEAKQAVAQVLNYINPSVNPAGGSVTPTNPNTSVFQTPQPTYAAGFGGGMGNMLPYLALGAAGIAAIVLLKKKRG